MVWDPCSAIKQGSDFVNLGLLASKRYPLCLASILSFICVLESLEIKFSKSCAVRYNADKENGINIVIITLYYIIAES